MKLGTLIVVLAAAGPAAAVPPAPPPPGDLAVAQAYIRSMRANDLRGYAGLFDPETKIAVDKTVMSPNEPAWTRILSGEFSNPSRKVEFIRVLETPYLEDKILIERFVLVERVTDCRPGYTECFPFHRIETLDVKDGHIARLQRSEPYLTELSPDGAQTGLGLSR